MRPGLRSRSVKKVSKKLPGGGLTTHFKKSKPSRQKCASCGVEIHGLPRLKPVRYSNLNKSAKTVSRKYGASLCSKCAREKIKKSCRVKNDVK